MVGVAPVFACGQLAFAISKRLLASEELIMLRREALLPVGERGRSLVEEETLAG